MYRNDRNGQVSGGTILYISDKVEHRVCRPLNSYDFDSSSWCWIVEKQGKKTLVGSVYRSTSSPPENDEQMLKLLEKADEVAGNNRLLVMRDFNVPKVDWPNKELMAEASPIDRLTLEITTDCLWHQHVTKKTRFRNGEASTLDLIFTKEEEDIKNIEVLPGLGLSDHGVVIADFVCEWKSKVEKKPRRMYHKGQYNHIIEGLNQVNWDTEFGEKSVQECCEIFKAKLQALIETYVPMSTPRDYNEPWMNKKTHEILEKETLCLEKVHRKERLRDI